MEHPGFFRRLGPFSITEFAAHVGAVVEDGNFGTRRVVDIKPLSEAGPEDVSFFDNKKYLDSLLTTKAGACLIAPSFASRLPQGTAALTTKTPYSAFAAGLTLFYEDLETESGSIGASISSSARIAAGVKIAPGAIIGDEAVIGPGTRVEAGAVVGTRVVIGSNCYLGPNSTVTHALLGDRVILHSGVSIGQDGFGFALGRGGHAKIPQVGRVMIGDDVEIGANSTVDRGAMADTVIGSGTKIDNLVQIAHNVIIGRHCIIVAQSGIAGSARLGDHVIMGAQSGVLGHVTVGDGAHIAGTAHVKSDVAPGQRVGGTPAVPFVEWARQLAAIKRLGQR